MIVTPEQTKRLKEMDRELKEMFPVFYGSVRFNLNPNIKKFKSDLRNMTFDQQQFKFFIFILWFIGERYGKTEKETHQ